MSASLALDDDGMGMTVDMAAAVPPPTDLTLFTQPLGNGLSRLDPAVDGIDCAACMPIIETGLAREPGIVAARVNLTNRRLTVDWRDEATGPQAIIDRLARLGFKAYPFDPKAAESAEAREARFLLKCLGVAGFAMMNIMLLSVSVWSGNISDLSLIHI